MVNLVSLVNVMRSYHVKEIAIFLTQPIKYELSVSPKGQTENKK